MRTMDNLPSVPPEASKCGRMVSEVQAVGNLCEFQLRVRKLANKVPQSDWESVSRFPAVDLQPLEIMQLRVPSRSMDVAASAVTLAIPCRSDVTECSPLVVVHIFAECHSWHVQALYDCGLVCRLAWHVQALY